MALRAGNGIYVINILYVIPTIALLSFLSRMVEKRWRLASHLLVALCFGFIVLLLYRGSVIFTFFVFLLSSQAIFFRFKAKFLWIGIAIISFFVIVTAFRVSDSAETKEFIHLVAEKIGQRFVTPITQLGYVMDTFPRDGFPPGKTYIMDIMALKPGYDVSFNGLIYKEMGNWGKGTATITILGECYVNFGYLGIVFVFFSLGAILQWLHFWLLRGGKKTTDIAIYSILSIYIGKTVISGITGILSMIVISLFVAVTLYSGSNFIKLGWRKRALSNVS